MAWCARIGRRTRGTQCAQAKGRPRERSRHCLDASTPWIAIHCADAHTARAVIDALPSEYTRSCTASTGGTVVYLWLA